MQGHSPRVPNSCCSSATWRALVRVSVCPTCLAERRGPSTSPALTVKSCVWFCWFRARVHRSLAMSRSRSASPSGRSPQQIQKPRLTSGLLFPSFPLCFVVPPEYFFPIRGVLSAKAGTQSLSLRHSPEPFSLRRGVLLCAGGNPVSSLLDWCKVLLLSRRSAFVLLPLLWRVKRPVLQVDVLEQEHQPLMIGFGQLQAPNDVCDVVDCRTEARPR